MPDSTTKPKFADAPGHIVRRSKNGWTVTWQPRTDLAKRNCPIKKQRVLNVGATPTDDERLQVGDRCTALQHEMLTWAKGGAAQPIGKNYDGTVEGLFRQYETNPVSPFLKRRQATRTTDQNRHRRITDAYGKVAISKINLTMVTTWRDGWVDEIQARQPGKGVPMANKLVAALRSALAFGEAFLECDKCRAASASLHKSKFEIPKSKKRPVVTREQVNAFRKAAHDMGLPEMALGAAIQYETAMRQLDIIGEWVSLTEKNAPLSDIIAESQRWVRGLRWNEFKATATELILTHTTSKRQKEWTGDVYDQAMIREEFAKQFPNGLPASGPVMVYKERAAQVGTGLPFKASKFRKVWRAIANRAGIPKHLENRHIRAGRITELLLAGVPPQYVQKFAGHADLKTTMIYYGEDEKAIQLALSHGKKTGTVG